MSAGAVAETGRQGGLHAPRKAHGVASLVGSAPGSLHERRVLRKRQHIEQPPSLVGGFARREPQPPKAIEVHLRVPRVARGRGADAEGDLVAGQQQAAGSDALQKIRVSAVRFLPRHHLTAGNPRGFPLGARTGGLRVGRNPGRRAAAGAARSQHQEGLISPLACGRIASPEGSGRPALPSPRSARLLRIQSAVR